MLTSLCWVPRGAPTTKLPDHVKADDEMEVSKSQPSDSDSDAVQEEEDVSAEVDIAQILANDLDTLSFHKPGEDDPYLSSDPRAKELFDDEELEDLTIRPTDALIVAVKSGEDASTLEVNLFDDDPDGSDGEDNAYVPHTYIHHDLVIPTFPLCTAYTRLQVDGDGVNLVAVGMFTPGIDIWDIDRVNNLEPVVTLGGYGGDGRLQGALAAAAEARAGNKTKRKNTSKLQMSPDSHQDAVMCLSWNSVQLEYLASGSADTTVKIWDIESTHCASTLTHHRKKVQAVAFHPEEAQLLLSGSFDRSVHVIDVRDSSKTSAWSVKTDIETCNWGYGPTSGMIIATTEDGYVSVFDPRKSGDEESCVASWCAHEGPTSACSVSRDIPGLMVTGGVDKLVKVWDIASLNTGKAADLIYEKQAKCGALFTVSLCPLPGSETNASPFVVAYGGSKGRLGLTDLAVESEMVRNRFLDGCSEMASRVIQKRASRKKKFPRSDRKEEIATPQSNGSHAVDGDDSEEDRSRSSGWESEHED